MPTLSANFKALLSEAAFTKEMLGAGATQIRKANYTTKGIYFQAFTSLATGLERIGKLCLMVDHYIDTGGKFPDIGYMKKEICHNLCLIYARSKLVVKRREISFDFLNNLDDAIHQNILTVLSNFNKGDRYSNINLLAGRKGGQDPIAVWYETVDKLIFDTRVPAARKLKISKNAREISELIQPFTLVRHLSETGVVMTSVEEASFQTGFFESVAPRRQVYVLQIIRYWVELLRALQLAAMKVEKEDIPFFSEMFAAFYNDNAYIRSRKTWDSV